MREATVWLLYDPGDFALNRDFADMMRLKGEKHGLAVITVLTSELELGMDESGEATCLRAGKAERPDAVISRQRTFGVSRHFEAMGAPVFNSAATCLLCNDKRLTHQFLHGLPMARTRFVPAWREQPAQDAEYPLILKPACSHGGDRVTLVQNDDEWRAAAARIRPEPMLEQRMVSGAGRDLRVYAVFGQIVAGVMRTAKAGVISNFKLGGGVAPHELTTPERDLAQRVIRRFDEAGAPLCFAGIDLLYEGDAPVVGEVEDVVGSRMLYQTSDIDIVDLYLARIAEALRREK